MEESRKITIVEGPPPTFELVSDTWSLGIVEGPLPKRVALCRVRTSNGPALVERCHRAWREGQPIYFEFRDEGGLTQQAPILAARWLEHPDGHLLLLWVPLDEDQVEFEIDFDMDDLDEDDLENFDFDLPL